MTILDQTRYAGTNMEESNRNEEPGSSTSIEIVGDKREIQKKSILDKVASSDAFFKSQQRDDPDLTIEDKRKIAEELLNSNLPMFLQRYSRYLEPEDAEYFDTQRGDYEVDYYLREHVGAEGAKKRRMRTKNRRYEALQKLVKEGEYFSDTEMRRRNPLLFEQMVGKYMTPQEKQEIDKMFYTDDGFSGFLMSQIDRNELNQRQKLQQDEEDMAFEESDSDEEEDNRGGPRLANSISVSEKEMLKSEFQNIMYESFLAGKDDYDYASVDNNTEYDSIKMRQEDEEEKYFDAEDSEICTGSS